MIHRIAAALVLVAWCGFALGAAPPKTQEGDWVLATFDDAGRAGEQPHIKSPYDWWIKPDEIHQAMPDDARMLTFATGKSIPCKYASLDPKATYKLRLIFYNVVHKRVVKIFVNDKEVATGVDLPIEKVLVKEFELDAGQVAGGTVEARVDLVEGPSAILSAAEVWRRGEAEAGVKAEVKAEEVSAKPQAVAGVVPVVEAERAKPQAVVVPVVAPVVTPVVASGPMVMTTPTDGKALMMGAVVPSSGDTFVFVGDSLTHNWVSGGMYTQYVEDFFITRYPHAPMHFYNAGVSGSKVEGALARFDMDIKAQKPTYVSVLLGMNDAGYQPFDRGIFERFANGMRTLLDQVAGAGGRAIVVSPTWFDYRGVELNPKGDAALRAKFREYDATMAFYGAWLHDEANARGLGWADVRGAMSEVVSRERRSDAKFTLAPDSIHPIAPGNAVIAAAIIEQIQDSRRVSEVTASRTKSGWAVKSEDGPITAVRDSGEGVAFSFEAKSLPWVLPDDAVEGLKFVDGAKRLSSEVVRVVGLEPGKYELKIDGVSVGAWTSEQWAAGVELQENAKTPQHQQASAVMALNQERNTKAVHEMRKLFEATKGLPAADAVAKFDVLSREYEKRLYAAARPTVRKYEVVEGK